MNEKAFINEVRGFLFYSKAIWPLHRLLAKRHLTRRCRKCAISAKYSPVGSRGLCEACETVGDQPAPPRSPDQELIAELHKLISDHQGVGPGQFDALVLFSGGKDSSYMVHHIRQTFPGLRLLLFTVDNTFMSPLATKNIETLVTKFDQPHLTLRPPAAVYNKMFRHAFLNLNERGCSGTVDQFDGDFFHDLARNWAAQNKIPLVLSGCSKTQVQRILHLNHFEFPRTFEQSRREQVADLNLSDIFTSDEMKYWMNEAGQEGTTRPRVLFPFFAWDLDETEILAKVTEWRLLQPSARNPLLTNNQLIPTMAIVDMVKLGYSSFEPEFCQMIRSGRADPVFWRNVFELSEYAAKTGRFISQSVDQSLARLQLTRRELGIPK